VNDAHLQLTGISKHFQGVRALEDVDFSCRRGSIHAILGENGAGKSTLIKIVAGVLAPDSGEMRLDGRPAAFANPSEAADAGIVPMFQELSLIPDLTVAENISLADPPRRFGLIDRREERRRAEAVLARVRCEDLSPDALIRDLRPSRRQMVVIA
jgi:ribose transport system ATP-binding protein